MVADPTYQTKNYEKEGGDTWVVGGTLEIASGGTIVVDNGATLLQGANGIQSSGVVRAGQYSVTAGDVTATHSIIATGITTLASMNVMIFRSPHLVTADAEASFAAGSITVTSGSSYTLTAGDVINWIAVGA